MSTTTFVALLRAVNLGASSTLPMEELRTLCERAGFSNVRTYIASGNVVFDSTLSEAGVKSVLHKALAAHAGKPIGVMVRGGAEMAAVLADNPFADAPPSKTVAIFLDQPPPKDTLQMVTGAKREEVRLGKREIYVHYPDGLGRSRLKIRGAADGTARNMNTIAKLVEMART